MAMASPTTKPVPELFEQVACPSCGSAQYHVLSPSSVPPNLTDEQVIDFYSSSSSHKLMEQLAECAQCSLVYLNPRFREELILQGYSEAVDDDFFQQNEMRIRTFRRSLQKISKKYFPGRANLKILECRMCRRRFCQSRDRPGV